MAARHSALLANQLIARVSPAHRVRLIQQLQRDYGNAHVARVIAQIQRAPAAPPGGAMAQPDSRIQQVDTEVRGAIAQTKPHATPAAKAAEARHAAEPPANEPTSQAATAQVEEMSQQAQVAFNKLAFIWAVYGSIDAATPKTLPPGTTFVGSGAAEQVKTQGEVAVAQNAQGAQQNLKAVTMAPPDPAKAIPKPVAPLVPERPAPAPAGVDATRAVPPPKAAANVSLEAGPAQLNAIMAEAKVTDQQLAESDEPQFQEALAAKQQVEHNAHEAPRAFRAEERKIRAATKAEGIAGVAHFMSQMRGRVSGALARVDTRKLLAKVAQEFKRAEVAGKIEGIYGATRNEVKGILDGLEGKVEEAFTRDVENWNGNFDLYVDVHKEHLEESRYSGIGDTLKWWGDKATGLPTAAFNAIVARAREVYLRRMFSTISAIAELVATELNRAKARIAQGRQEIKAFVGQQQGDLQRVARDAESDFADQFDQLDQDLDDERTNLVGTLAQKFRKARESIDEHGQELIDHNRGFVGDAKAMVKGAVDTIKKLAAWLRDVLNRAEGVIGKIIRHPGTFFGHLVDSVESGFNNFVGRIGTHLEEALLGLVVDTLDTGGLTLPDPLDAPGILSVVLQVLGLTPANIRQRAVKLLGADVVDALEKVPGIISAIQSEGLGGLWTFIQDKFTELKDGLMSQVKQWLMLNIVEKGVKWLFKMLIPGSGFFKACVAIYDTVRFFIKNRDLIKHVVDAILDSLESIADGKTDTAASKIEGALSGFLKAGIAFLARMLDLDGIGERIKQIINESFRDPINQLVNGLLRGAATVAGPLLAKVKGGVDWAKKKGRQAKEWALSKVQVFFKVGTQRHRLFFEEQGGKPELMVASDPEKVRAYLARMEPEINEARTRQGGAAPLIFKRIDRLLGSTKATLAQAADVRSTDPTRAKKLMMDVAEPLRQLMALSRQFRKSPAAGAAAPNAAGLAKGNDLGVNIDMLRPNRRRVAGDQWIPHKVEEITPPTVKLRSVWTNTLHEFPLAEIVDDLVSGNRTRYKRISGPEELAEHGLYVVNGMLKPEFRGGDQIRSLFYPGDYAAHGGALLVGAQQAALTHPSFATGQPGGVGPWGPAAWLCPGYKRQAHILEEPGHVDHRISVAEHWSALGGNNTGQQARGQFNVDPTNLQLLCDVCNLSKGSNSASGTRANYLDSVGPNFTGPNGKR